MIFYIAGPMSGIPDFNYPAFNAAEVGLRRLGWPVLNPATIERDNPTPGVPQAWEWYMERALAMVVRSNGIALLPGWHSSRGARREMQVALALDLPVWPIGLLLDDQAVAL